MAKSENKKVGRPTIYTDQLAAEICKTISNTSQGLPTLCKQNPHWPCRDTIHQWINDKDLFSDMYAKAKMKQAEFMVEEMIGIADDSSRDVITKYNNDGDAYEVFNAEYAARSRLRIDTRKWIASKLAPKVYGERVQLGGTIGLKQEDSIKDLE